MEIIVLHRPLLQMHVGNCLTGMWRAALALQPPLNQGPGGAAQGREAEPEQCYGQELGLPGWRNTGDGKIIKGKRGEQIA